MSEEEKDRDLEPAGVNEETVEQEETTQEEPQEEQQKQKSGGWKDELKLFVPNKDFAVTQTLVIINVLVYLIMVLAGVNPIDPSVEDLISWGGNLDVLFSEGEYWRLLTSCFLHLGIVHLLMNMYALLFVGSYLERIIGHRRFLFAYIITGLISSLVSTWWHSNIVSVGASGAIFGMFGVFLILLLSQRIVKEDTRKDMLTSIVIFIGYNLLYGVKGEVDNAAHIGGLLSGIVVGFLYMVTMLKDPSRKTSLLESGVPIALLAVMFSLVYVEKGGDHIYTDEMKLFNEVLEIHERAQAELTLEDEAPLSKRKKEYAAFDLHLDSCFAKLNEYYETTPTEDIKPVFALLKEYLEVHREYLEAYHKYERNNFNAEYALKLDQLDEKMDQLILQINAQMDF